MCAFCTPAVARSCRLHALLHLNAACNSQSVMEDVSAAVLQRSTSGRACLAAVVAAGAVLVPASHVNAASWSWLASAYGVPLAAQPAASSSTVHAPSFLRTAWMSVFGDPASDATLLETAAGVALASGELHLAKQCVAVLQAVLRMPKSSRLARLRGMLAEAEGKHTEALKIYDDALTAAPMNVAVWKRKVAALKATSGEVAAAAELAKLCEAFPGDAEAVCLVHVLVCLSCDSLCSPYSEMGCACAVCQPFAALASRTATATATGTVILSLFRGVHCAVDRDG